MILGYSWAKFGKKSHIKLMVISYVYVILASFNIFCFELLLTKSFFVTRVFLSLQMCFEVFFASIVMSGLWREGVQYLASFWNQLRLIVIVGGFVGNILRMGHMVELRSTRVMLSVTSIAMWFEVLYFLRAFEGKGVG